MDSATALIVLYAAAGLLGLLINLLICYWIIRLAVSHALRSHTLWLQKMQKQRATNATGTIQTVP